MRRLLSVHFIYDVEKEVAHLSEERINQDYL